MRESGGIRRTPTASRLCPKVSSNDAGEASCCGELEPPCVGCYGKMVEAAGVEPASLAKLPAATTCLVRREFSSVQWRPDTESHSLARRIRDSIKPRAGAATDLTCYGVRPA